MVKDCFHAKVEKKTKMTKMSASATSIQHYNGDFSQSNKEKHKKERGK